jgi:hypothetical protein
MRFNLVYWKILAPLDYCLLKNFLTIGIGCMNLGEIQNTLAKTIISKRGA